MKFWNIVKNTGIKLYKCLTGKFDELWKERLDNYAEQYKRYVRIVSDNEIHFENSDVLYYFINTFKYHLEVDTVEFTEDVEVPLKLTYRKYPHSYFSHLKQEYWRIVGHFKEMNEIYLEGTALQELYKEIFSSPVGTLDVKKITTGFYQINGIQSVIHVVPSNSYEVMYVSQEKRLSTYLYRVTNKPRHQTSRFVLQYVAAQAA